MIIVWWGEFLVVVEHVAIKVARDSEEKNKIVSELTKGEGSSTSFAEVSVS